MIKYPYTDFHEMNLDWILNKIKELEENPSTDELEGRVEALEENAAELNEDSAWFKNRFKMFAVAENLRNFTFISTDEYSEGLVIFKNANEAKITVAKLSYVNGTYASPVYYQLGTQATPITTNQSTGYCLTNAEAFSYAVMLTYVGKFTIENHR